eukprot:TRINITY_DN10944_c0_g1_i1.p1 TRINITY_DN10944_c0_g1~~TRINITY_DN10944_c0_g1_i1.p1  ORF type:complete len:364 (-),score=59.91 TRINITY_DN10944_c0_g1_i1:30-1121(-)
MLICLVVLAITRGEVDVLAGVYSCAFISVMTGMALCHYVFRMRCPYVRRASQVSTWISLFAGLATVTALVCQAADHPSSFLIALSVLIPLVLLTQATIQRQRILKWLAGFNCLHDWATHQSQVMGSSLQLVYFCGGSEDAEKLVAIIRTLEKNEVSRKVALVHFPMRNEEVAATSQDMHQKKEDLDSEDVWAPTMRRSSSVGSCLDATVMAENLEKRVEMLGGLFPNFEITFVSHTLEDGFGPEAVRWTMMKFGVEVGQLSIGVPGPHFPFGLGALLGVRILNLDTDLLVTNSTDTQRLVVLSRQASKDLGHELDNRSARQSRDWGDGNGNVVEVTDTSGAWEQHEGVFSVMANSKWEGEREQ